MTSGRSVYQEIEDKVGEATNSNSAAERKLYDLESQITAITEEREAIFLRLADIYTPDKLTPESIKNTLKEVEGEVKRVFAEKQARRKQLEVMMQDAQTEQKKFRAEIDGLSQQLDVQAEERERVQKEMNQELVADARYTVFKAQAEKADEILTQYKQRVEEVQAEAAQKLPAYTSNKLFMYLLRKNFDPNNPRTGIIAKLDSRVARYINFAEAKKNCDFLTAMPELMKAEVERRQEELNEVVVEMRKTEKRVSVKYGIATIEGGGRRLEEKRRRIIEQASSLNQDYQKYTQERAEMDSTKDPYVREAVQRLKTFLKADSIQQLKERAGATPGSEDDKLVARIEGADKKVRELKDKAIKARVARDEAEIKFRGLKKIQDYFTSHDYESSRSEFRAGFDIIPLLVGYMLGRHRADEVIREMDSHQHFKPRETSYSSSYSGSSRRSSSDESSSHSSGWGFGGGGFGSGGGFGGGGFSSGKGF